MARHINETQNKKIITLEKSIEYDIIHKSGSWFSYGEVKLGNYDLYPSLNTNGDRESDSAASLKQQMNSIDHFVAKVMNYLNLADGSVSLEEMKKKLHCGQEEIKIITNILLTKGLIEEDL